MEKRKFAVLTDSTCDIPDGLEKEYGVDILNFKIALDGEAYEERVDFTSAQYCEMLRNAKGTPTTSQITAYEFQERFREYDDAGVEEVLYVSINGTGSATNACAHQAAENFRTERPGSGMRIWIVDSHCYSFTYGVHVLQAARRLAAGERMETVVDFLNDIFARMEIILTAYTLKIIRKSGRVSAAAAIAGDLLGIHPIFTLNDGVSQVVKKVRGDKAVCANVCRLTKERIRPGAPYYLGISNPQYEREYREALTAALGYAPERTFELGCAVLSNTGPDAVGIVFEGKETRARA